MYNQMTLKQEYSIVITGGSKGIGAATAQLLSKYGNEIFILDKIEPDYNTQNMTFIHCDVSKHEQIEQAFKQIKARSKIGYLFCNAGIIEFGTVETTETEKIFEIINTNLIGMIFTLKYALPLMKENNFGKVVLMGSDQSFVGKKNMAVYGATKGAIAQLTKSTALDYAKYNILVNCICPGTIETELYRHTITKISQKQNVSVESIQESMVSHVPLHRNGIPQDVANAIQFLLSEQTNFITGALIPIDGGYTIK